MNAAGRKIKISRLFTGITIITMLSLILLLTSGCGNDGAKSTVVDNEESFVKAMESIDYQAKTADQISDTAIAAWRAFSAPYSTNVNVFVYNSEEDAKADFALLKGANETGKETDTTSKSWTDTSYRYLSLNGTKLLYISCSRTNGVDMDAQIASISGKLGFQ